MLNNNVNTENSQNDDMNIKQDVKTFQEEFDNLHEGELEKQEIKANAKDSKNSTLKAADLEDYLKDKGISAGFELIFTELILKEIKKEDYFSYAASRLRDMGRKLEKDKQQI
jgi:hypothetical protein